MSTLKVSNIQHSSAASAAIALDANGQATLNGLAFPTSGSLSGRNRIINGDMRIDQRNAGAAVTAVNAGYTIDRWRTLSSAASKFTVQRSSTAPTGFTNSALITSSSAYTPGASEIFSIEQAIEGFNISDLGWGTANAVPATLTFRVRSSLTGTFGGVIKPASYDYTFPFTYTISAANTWETKTISIAGPTVATFGTDNTAGGRVIFGLGVGSTSSGTADGTWRSGDFYSATGATSVVGTNGATFYLTGVQLEAGTVATPFERRSYGQELALCQRYFAKLNEPRGRGTANTTTSLVRAGGSLPLSMRIAPNISLSGTLYWYDGFGVGTIASTSVSSVYSTSESYEFDATLTTGTSLQGRALSLYIFGSNGTISAGAEL